MNRHDDALRGAVAAFSQATRSLAEGIDGSDPERLSRAMSRQADCFEELRGALALAGTRRGAEGLERAVADARDVLAEATRRRNEIRAELDTIRRTRAATRRVRTTDDSARFVSRRV